MNKKEILDILQQLAAERAPSGLETNRGEKFKEIVENILIKKDIRVKKDKIGNYFVKFKGTTGKKAIAILAHIDEIGGTIRKIKKNGRLEFSKRGGYEGRWLISKQVKILGRSGEWVNGVICGRSTHSTPTKLRSKEKIEPLELEIYIGAESLEDVIKNYNIHIGSPFVFDGDFELLNPKVNEDVIAGYSMDNLAALGCTVILIKKIVDKMLTEFVSVRIPYDIYIAATTREEIGTEGAHYFLRTNEIDKVIAIDIGLVADFKGAVSSDIKLKGGPVIVWQDSLGKGIYDYQLCSDLRDVAERNKLSYQDGVFEFYGSDAGKAQKWLGIPSALIGIPTMFSHNVPEISTLSGIEQVADLLLTFLKNLKK